MKNVTIVSRVPVAGLGAVTWRVVETAQESKMVDVVTDTAYTNLEQKSEKYRQSINKRRYSELTDEMVALDKNRDSLSSGMRKYVASQLDSPVVSMSDAALKVQRVLDRFVGVEVLSFGDESVNLRNMVAELRATGLQASVTTLNLKPWIDAIETANEAFELKIRERGDDVVAIHEVKSASVLRRELEQALRDYFEFVHALVILKKTDDLKNFEKRLYERVEAVVAPLNRTPAEEVKK